MKNETYNINGKNYKRISKNQAEKLFLSGETILFAPVNYRIDTWFNLNYETNLNHVIEVENHEKNFNDSYLSKWYKNYFDYVLTYFERYNCTCSETGRYSKFFIEC